MESTPICWLREHDSALHWMMHSKLPPSISSRIHEHLFTDQYGNHAIFAKEPWVLAKGWYDHSYWCLLCIDSNRIGSSTIACFHLFDSCIISNVFMTGSIDGMERCVSSIASPRWRNKYFHDFACRKSFLVVIFNRTCFASSCVICLLLDLSSFQRSMYCYLLAVNAFLSEAKTIAAPFCWVWLDLNVVACKLLHQTKSHSNCTFWVCFASCPMTSVLIDSEAESANLSLCLAFLLLCKFVMYESFVYVYFFLSCLFS